MAALAADETFRVPSRPAPKSLQTTTEEPCVVCGRAIDDSKCQWVHLVHGVAVPVEYDGDPNDPADQGWYAVGPECAKLIPAEFRK